jgi:hypothetical protein
MNVRLVFAAVAAVSSLAGCGGGGESGGAATPTVQFMSLAPTSLATGVGVARRITATGTLSDGSQVDVTASATWSSSAVTVATVSAGVVSGITTGSTTITATVDGISASSTISVTANNTWNAAGSLNLARAGHEAALLPGGKLLVMDGASSAVTDSFESYDPVSDAWSLGGSPGEELYGRTLTALNNGSVMLAGGGVDPTSCGGAVTLYDPTTQAISAANGMALARAEHTATLLPNGKVLVVGGDVANCANFVGQPAKMGQMPEIFDPGTGTWAPAANVLYPRFNHTATLLADGRVLVAGGASPQNPDVAVTAAEVYDPTNNTWATAGSMSSARYGGQTATLLPDGRVLVTGGSVSLVEQLPDGQFLTGAAQAAAEIYDPNTNAWSTVASMATARTAHTATLFNGKVLVAGGASALAFGYSGVPAPQVFSSTEVFDPASGTWSSAASMTTARVRHTATLLQNDTVLITGGATDGSGLTGAMTKSSELYW